MDAKGNLYGTTIYGGAYGESDGGWGHGTVFELSPPVTAGDKWTETVLHSFGASETDGTNPYAGLMMDASGNLYGSTYWGGAYTSCTGEGGGTAFELSPPTTVGGKWTETVLHSFGATCNDGVWPYAGLIMDAKGNLYGTTWAGGGQYYGDGTAFELSPPTKKDGPWTETLLHEFGATSTSPWELQGGLIMDAKGNLYGTTDLGGGEGCEKNGCGAAFELSP